MGQLERYLLLQIIDERWREHLFDMDYLREGIDLRGIAQIDPLVAYKNEAYTLFGDLINSIWADYARMIFNVQIVAEGQNGRRRGSNPCLRGSRQPHPSRARLLLGRGRRDGRRCDRGRCRGSRFRRRPGIRRRQRRGRAGTGASGRAARGRLRAPGGPQRPLLVRLGEEVQEVPRRVGAPWTRRIAASSVARVPSTLRSLRPCSAWSTTLL